MLWAAPEVFRRSDQVAGSMDTSLRGEPRIRMTILIAKETNVLMTAALIRGKYIGIG
jgi:hypothetical protein